MNATRFALVLGIALLLIAVTAPAPATASHTPCLSHYDHGYQFRCAPDASDPLCIPWFFELGDAKVCLRDWLP